MTRKNWYWILIFVVMLLVWNANDVPGYGDGEHRGSRTYSLFLVISSNTCF